jgi:ParB/RepB/Spo0J family partition protein
MSATKPKKPDESLGTMLVPLNQIVSNIGQSRGMGVLPNLLQLGWGLFETPPDFNPDEYPPIWGMLTGTDADAQKKAAQLLVENEEAVVGLATAIETEGQLQPIGVSQDGDNYNVVFGMRRCLAIAYLAIINPKIEAQVEAKVWPKQSAINLRFLAMSENQNREDESPIDRALTYEWLKSKEGGGLEVKDIAERGDESPDTIYAYLKLLRPQLEPWRWACHCGEKSVDWMLKKLQSLKEGTDGSADSTKRKKRFPPVAKIKDIAAGKFPDDMKDELRELYKNEYVRKFISLTLGLKLKDYVEPKPEPAKAESNGAAPKGKSKATELSRAVAEKLLIALGNTNAATFADDTIVTKLEGIGNLGEPDFQVGDEKLQKWYDHLHKLAAKGAYKLKLKK